MLVFQFEVITALENGMKPGQAAKKLSYRHLLSAQLSKTKSK
jgi:hypothetical protein